MPETLFAYQNALVVLGAWEDLGAYGCLRLALEGYQVIGLGFNEGKLKQIKRDVEDVKGSFSYFVVTPSNGDEIALNIFDKFNRVNFIIIIMTKTSMGEFLENPVDVYEKSIGAQRDALANFFYHFCNEYKRSIKARKQVTRIAHIIDVVSVNEIRLSRLYLENVDTTIAPDNEENVSIFPGFSPSIVMNEIFNLLINKEYQSFNDISIRISDQNVYVLLYVPGEKGVLNFTKPIKQFKWGTVLNTYLKETPDRGKGIFAVRDFHRGELIVQTTGKVLKHQTEHSLQIGWDRHLEPDPPVRWINHSCEPNAGVRTNALGFPDIIALRDIQAHDEITFDYAMTEYKHYERENPEMEFDLTCRCGAEHCRGKLGYYSELPEHLKKKYEGFISDYLIKGENS